VKTIPDEGLGARRIGKGRDVGCALEARVMVCSLLVLF
jgi:hypothetical protein